MADVPFTMQEANTLIKLLDDAVKYGGLPNAESALYFHRKLKESLSLQAPVEPKE